VVRREPSPVHGDTWCAAIFRAERIQNVTVEFPRDKKQETNKFKGSDFKQKRAWFGHLNFFHCSLFVSCILFLGHSPLPRRHVSTHVERSEIGTCRGTRMFTN
jgi:hypothetical protein